MPSRTLRLRRLFCCMVLVLAGSSAAAMALEPDQIALVVNKDVPAGRKLAEFYAAQRGIPAGRIIELSLKSNPENPSEDISAADFDEKVLPPVRDFLKGNGLDNKVRCLVTFWGVPLRVDRRSATDADKKEETALKAEAEQVRGKIQEQAAAAEALAEKLDPAFKPGKATDIDSVGRRVEVALNTALRGISKITDAQKRAEVYEPMMALVRDVGGEPAVVEKISQPDFWPLAPKKPTTDEIMEARKHVADLQKQINEMQLAQPQTAESRAKLIEIFKKELGSLNVARLVYADLRALDNAESEAAFDSELALLWWPPYPKARWEANPLNWHIQGRLPQLNHTLMVMRLDGPSEASVHQIITDSMAVEEAGLSGEVVLDARGKPPTEPYGVYDQTIRNLAAILKEKTPLKVVFDDKEPLIAENSQSQIAIYCGWYSLHKYVSPGTFNRGAVGFHIASSEMVSLHNPNETGWSSNLIKAGVVATLGPVAEPYLQSFPPADEFFPLLMTGKLSLAEVYWKTTPWTSWMQCCVGDPLYKPYKANPALKVTDLPEQLKPLVQ